MAERFYFNDTTPKKSDYVRRYQPYSTPRRHGQDDILAASFRRNLTFTTPRKPENRNRYPRGGHFKSNDSTPKSSRSLSNVKVEPDDMFFNNPTPSRSWTNDSLNEYTPIVPVPGYIASAEEMQCVPSKSEYTPGFIFSPEQLHYQQRSSLSSEFVLPPDDVPMRSIKQECSSPTYDPIPPLIPGLKKPPSLLSGLNKPPPPLIPGLRNPLPPLQPKNSRPFYQRVPCRTDFTKLNKTPHFKLVLSTKNVLKLIDPMNCVFSEVNDHWIVADRQKGIVVVNRDCSLVIQTYSSAYIRKPSAVILVNDGSQAAVLDDNGIHILDFRKGTFVQILRRRHCRGLGMTLTGDFVTFDTFSNETLIIPQDTLVPIKIPYGHSHEKNDENQMSRVSYIGVSDRRICLIDYTLGMITMYRYDPFKREILETAERDCSKHVAQCRLSGCFVDCEGRLLVANCKEQQLMHFDQNADFLRYIDVEKTFCRSAGLYVNSSFQTLVIDTWTQEIRFGKLCDLNI